MAHSGSSCSFLPKLAGISLLTKQLLWWWWQTFGYLTTLVWTCLWMGTQMLQESGWTLDTLQQIHHILVVLSEACVHQGHGAAQEQFQKRPDKLEEKVFEVLRLNIQVVGTSCNNLTMAIFSLYKWKGLITGPSNISLFGSKDRSFFLLTPFSTAKTLAPSNPFTTHLYFHGNPWL